MSKQVRKVPAAPSFIRTYIPIVVGYVVSFFTSLGVDLTDEQEKAFTTTLGALVAIVWYLVFRFLEQKWPKLGAFLGWAKTPGNYARDHDVVESEAVEESSAEEDDGPRH